MHLLTPSRSSNLHKMIQTPFKLPVPTLYSLNTKNNVNVKVNGRCRPFLNVHVIFSGRLLKPVSLNDFHCSSTKAQFVQLRAHQKKKVKDVTNTKTILLLLFFYHYINFLAFTFIEDNVLEYELLNKKSVCPLNLHTGLFVRLFPMNLTCYFPAG